MSFHGLAGQKRATHEDLYWCWNLPSLLTTLAVILICIQNKSCEKKTDIHVDMGPVGEGAVDTNDWCIKGAVDTNDWCIK